MTITMLAVMPLPNMICPSDPVTASTATFPKASVSLIGMPEMGVPIVPSTTFTPYFQYSHAALASEFGPPVAMENLGAFPVHVGRIICQFTAAEVDQRKSDCVGVPMNCESVIATPVLPVSRNVGGVPPN